MVERARAAADAGLDSLFVGDHHNVPVPYYQNVPMLGRLLAEWDTRPAGALFLLPLWHPVLLAEQIGTLASIARGPFIMQCAVGGGAEQFARVRRRRAKRGASRFEAALDVDPPAVRGRRGVDRHAVRDRAGAHRAGAARAARGVDRRARRRRRSTAPRGSATRSSIGPEATPRRGRASSIATYREACARHGRDAGRRSRSGATSTSAPTMPTPSGSRGRSSRAATAASTPPRRSWAGRAQVAARLRRAGRDGLHRRHHPPPRRRPDRGAARRSSALGARSDGTVGDALQSGRMRRVEPRWIDDRRRARRACVDELADEPRYAPRHRVPRRALVLAPARADPDRVAERHRAGRPARDRPAPLGAVLAGPGCMVAHAAEQDLAILERACGHGPTQLFDTQVAAGFIGLGTPSLAALVERLLGVRLAKGDRLTDWTRRPLRAEQTRLRGGRRRAPARAARRARRSASTRSAASNGRSTSARNAASGCAPGPIPKPRGGASRARASCAARRAASRRKSRRGASAPRRRSTCRRATCSPISRSRASCSDRRDRARS